MVGRIIKKIFNLKNCCILLAGKEVLKDEQFLETIIKGIFIILIFYIVEKTSNCKFDIETV
jgi:hypothetical protein